MPLFRPLKRLRAKASGPEPLRAGVQEEVPPHLLDESGISKRQVYLVTCPHTHQAHAAGGAPLHPPSSYNRQALLNALLDACANPVYDERNAGRGLGGVRLCRCLIAAEYHRAGADGQAKRHYHIAVQAFASFRFVSVKRALLERHGIATHWSATHVGYWSAISYLVKSSDNKPRACLDPNPLPWHVDGRQESLQELAARPTTAASIEARREKAVERAETSGKPEPRPSEIDIWPIIVKNNIRNDQDVDATKGE